MKRRAEKLIVWIILKMPGNKKLQVDNTIEPIWILGMFRSGTSFLSNVLYDSGLDFGQPKYLLQAQGRLKDLNPKGFFEDFVFAEISRFILYKIKRSGEKPPSISETNKIFFNSININELIYHSFFKIRDDRVSFQNKISAYLMLKFYGINGYLRSNYGKTFAIKIPLLTFFHTDLLYFWPKSKFIVAFRDPSSVVKSSQILVKNASADLYQKFYEHLVNLDALSDNVIYLSYDKFLREPAKDIQKLSAFTGIREEEIMQSYKASFDETLIRNKPVSDSAMAGIEIYKELLIKAE